MRKFGFAKLALMVTASVCLLTAGLSRAASVTYIDINNPFLRKIPIAIPFFKPLGSHAEEIEASRKAAELLAGTLEFSGYFKLMDRGAFLEDPSQSGISAAELHFRNWTAVGAELLITGGVRATADGSMEFELRLFDTFTEKMLIGKKYSGPQTDQRPIIQRFCSEVIFQLTGSKGVFDTQIAFISTGSGNKEIYLCDFDGSNPVQFTHKKSITLFPAWSSDRKWIAYTSYAKGKPELYIQHNNGTTGALLSAEGMQITPAWVPNQFELAATLSFSGDQEIYLLTGSGKIIKRLTNNRGIDVEPTWSPDGKKLAFVSRRAGSPQIYISDVLSGQVERLTYEGNYNTQPNWSPKGNKIAYSSLQNGRLDVFVIDVNKKAPIQLTFNAGNNEAPSFSPDGSLIAFGSTREGPSRIYVMTAYGTDQRRLLAMPGEQTGPKWSPNGINN